MPAASERTFLDTNILIYADAADAGDKGEIARTRVKRTITEGQAVISTQVLQEYFVTATKKLSFSAEQARARVEFYSQFDVVLLQPDLVLSAIDLHRLHSLSFWDAMVIRAAAVGGCKRLLSEDLQHGRVIDGVTIENPFAANKPVRRR